MDPTPELPLPIGSLVVAEAQMDLRRAPGASDRPTTRRLQVLDLPDELMLKIFEFVRSQVEPGCSTQRSSYSNGQSDDIESVKSVRLTCHRFCRTSSHLLLRRLDVAMSPSSLAHCEEVSRHPTISKGIRALRVDASLYGSAMATDFWHFATMCRTRFNQHIRQLAYQRSLVDPRWSLKEEERTEVFERAELILSSWTYYIDNQQEPDDERGRLDVAALRRGHERYRQLHQEQKSILQDDTFVQTIAAAAARMPMADRLTFTDRELPMRLARREKHAWKDRMDAPSLWIDEEMCLPSTWGSQILGLEQPPTRFLYQVPLAISRAGTSLAYLVINITAPTAFDLTLEEGEQAEFKLATQNLRTFGFVGWQASHGIERPARDPQDTTRFMEFLVIPLAAPKAESLHLYFNFLHNTLDRVHHSIVASALSPYPLEYYPNARGYRTPRKIATPV